MEGGRFRQSKVAAVGHAPLQACPFKKLLNCHLFLKWKHQQATTSMLKTQTWVLLSRKWPQNAGCSPHRLGGTLKALDALPDSSCEPP